jgi:hypothetical protein
MATIIASLGDRYQSSFFPLKARLAVAVGLSAVLALASFVKFGLTFSGLLGAIFVSMLAILAAAPVWISILMREGQSTRENSIAFGGVLALFAGGTLLHTVGLS